MEICSQVCHLCSNSYIQWYSTGGVCEDSAVSVCSGESGEKWLKTQYISKSLPAPDEYPVRVFVNITYSSVVCPPSSCEGDIELRIAHSTMSDFSRDGLMPNNRIILQNTTASTTQQFYFDISEVENGFFLVLISHSKGVCVTVSRVLVYRYECPGQEQLSTGLTRRPATQAPVSGRVLVMPYCAENSRHSDTSRPEYLVCNSEGHWFNDQTHCVCDIGYSRDGDKCEGSTYILYSRM